jgi:hypothetical protein
VSTPPSQYAYGQPEVPSRRSGMTTAGKVLFFVGLVLTVITVIVGIWGLNRAIQDFSQMERDAVAVQGSASVPMEAGDVRLILAAEGSDTACTVSAPGGEELEVTSDPTMGQAAAQEGISVVGTFTATETGEHTVTCDGPAELSPALSLGDAVGIGTAGVAFLAFFPLAFITLLGLVLWLVGRSRDKKASGGPSGPGCGYGYGGTSVYPGPGYGAPGAATDAPPGDQPYGSPYGSPPPPPREDRAVGDERRDGHA